MPQNDDRSALAGDGTRNGIAAAASSISRRAALIGSWFEFMSPS
jgi:hypothetical protein